MTQSLCVVIFVLNNFVIVLLFAIISMGGFGVDLASHLCAGTIISRVRSHIYIGKWKASNGGGGMSSTHVSSADNNT